MADTPTAGETVATEALKNDAGTTTAPITDNGSTAEVERLRREAEQAQMRANQLQNELTQRRQAEEEAQRRQLEEKEEYKTLYESTLAEKQRLENERVEAQTQTERQTAQTELLKDYPSEVADIVATTGLSLAGVTDADKEAFKSKLDVLAERVVPGTKVAGNNPAPTVKADDSKKQMLDGMKVGFKPAAGQYISSLESIKEMRRNAGLKVE